MDLSPETPQTDSERKQLANDIEAAHKIALHSEKLGKRLVRKTVKLIESGTTEKVIYSPRIASKKADPESTTLALNAELRDQDIDAKAAVTREWDGSIGDPTDYTLLRLTEVGGEEITPPANSKHRG